MKTRRTARRAIYRKALALAVLLIAPLAIFGGAAPAAEAQAPPPSFDAHLPIPQSVLDQALRKTGDPPPSTFSTSFRKTAASGTATAPTSTETTPEIEALAAALENDVDLIFAFVHDEIAFTPIWGSHKGAMGTLLNRAGGSFDQASLLVALLRAAGHPARFVFGRIELDIDQALNWLDCKDAGAATYWIVGSGYRSGENWIVRSSDGTFDGVQKIEIDHVWVEVEVDGTFYSFDPSLKSHTTTPGIDIATATGYDEQAFLAAALEGATTGEDFVQNLNQEKIDEALTTYTMNLVDEIRQNHPAASLHEIVGGREIVPLAGARRDIQHPFLDNFYENWEEIPDSYRMSFRVEHAGIDWSGYADALPGKTLHLLYEGEEPVLRLESVELGRGAPVAPGNPETITTTLDHPFTFLDGTYNDATRSFPILAGDGHLYTILQASGTAAPPLREHHVRRQAEASAAGNAADSPAVMRETLAILGAQFLIERTHLLDSLGELLDTHHSQTHQTIVIGQEGAPYIDIQTLSGWYTRNSGGSLPSRLANTGFSSSLERGVFRQLDAGEAVSTTRLFALANQQGLKFFDIDLANFSSIEPQLSDYSQGGLASIQNTIDQGGRALAPASGNLGIGGWEGYGAIGITEAYSDYEIGGLLKPPVDAPVCGVSGCTYRASWSITYKPGPEPTKSGHVQYRKPPKDVFPWNITNKIWGVYPAGDIGRPDIPPAAEAAGVTGVYLDRIRRWRVEVTMGSDSVEEYTEWWHQMFFEPHYWYEKTVNGKSFYVKNYGLPTGENEDGGRITGDFWGSIKTAASQGEPMVPNTIVSTKDSGWIYDGMYSDFTDGGVFLRCMGAKNTVTAGTEQQYPQVTFYFEQDYYVAETGLNGGYVGESGTVNTSETGSASASSENESGTPSFDPIDLYTGFFFYHRDDLSVGGGGLPFQLGFRRSYHAARHDMRRTLGRGWQHNFDIRVREAGGQLPKLGQRTAIGAASSLTSLWVTSQLMSSDAAPLAHLVVGTLVQDWNMSQQVDNAVVVARPGATEQFVKLPDGSFNPPPGSASALRQEEDGSYHLTTKHGVEIDFSTDGQIEQWRDPNSNTLSFTYASEKLQSVSNDVGRRLDFSYYASSSGSGLEGAIERVSDETGRFVKYEYDADGNLVSYQDTEGATTRYEYDAVGGMARIYYPSHPDTPSVQNVFDAFGRVTQQTEALGNTWHYAFAGHRTSEIDPEGNKKVWYFDPFGKVTRSIDALGYETAQTFDGARRVTSRSLPDGQRVDYEYDSRHNRTQNTIFPASGSEEPPLVTSYTYESTFNRVTSVTDPRGFTTQYAYDEKGNLTSIIAPEVDGSAATTAFSYNDRGQVTSVTDAEGTLTQYVYDTTTGELLQTVVDAGGLNLTGSLSYDTAGNVVAQTDPRGNTTTFSYDKRRQLLATTPADPAAARTTSLYDDDGFLIAVTRLDPATGGEALTTSFDYDAAGRRTHVTDPEGNTTVKGYDDLGRPFQTIDALGRVRETRYDARGQVFQEIDGLGNAEATYSYTPGGQVQILVDAKDNETHYVYDGFGRLAETAYANGTYEEFSYDAAGHLVRHLPRRHLPHSPFWLSHYSYDALGRLESKQVTTGGSESFAYRYDGVGRLISASNSLGTTDHHYDGAGRLVQVEHPGGQLVGYAYDAAGNRTGVTYPTGASVAYAYDAQNRMTEVHEMGMISARYRYDAFSRRSEVFHGWGGTTTSYSYQQDGDLAKLRHVAAAAEWSVDFDYSYDAAHNRIGTQVSDPAFEYELVRDVSAAYTTNELNQYTSVASVAQGFDPNGNLASDGTNHYLHDQEGRLTRVTTPTWEYVDYGYDALGRRTQRSFRDETTYTVYDGLRPLVEYDAAGTALRTYIYGAGLDEAVGFWTGGERYSLHHDGQGSVVALTDDMSNRVEHYRYGPFGETEGTSVLGNPIRYTGRFYDETTGLYDNRLRNYHPVLGRFIEPDPIGPAGGINLYAYVNSNPINFIDPLGLSARDNGGVGYGSGQSGFSGIQNFNPVKFSVGVVNTGRGLMGLAAGTVTLGVSAGASTVVGPLALPGTSVGIAQLAFGVANLSRGIQQINESPNDSAGPSLRNVLGLLPFGQEFDDPLEPLPQNFVAQRLQGLTTSPIATGGRLLNEFFAFGPDESGANP